MTTSPEYVPSPRKRGTRTRDRRSALIVILGGLIGTVLLALSLTGTLSAFTAAITNTTDTVSTGSLVMQETDGTNTCTSSSSSTNSANCATINKYTGNTLMPGGSATKTVTLSNQGSITPATFTLTPATCSQSGSVSGITPASDFCAQVTLKIYAAATATGPTSYNGTLAAFTTPLSLTALAPAGSQAYTFVVSLPAGLGNSYMGLTASQQLTWTFSS
ncbi:hypothetical protein [Actinokineospora terrae]|uniref:SipW-cognate class signal peptide n=1 Tax=Actinokineospora terrae TaxID=155974 RepID=A0A1H9L7Y4_9PSEU|nr:hypothetical protein [Actinokineospora terrae]SER07339.1 hypothetical protein SAMN04487818_101490 [Actinokineospora terrae]